MTSDHFMKTLGTVVGIEGYLASRIAAEDAEKKWTGLTRHRDGGQAGLTKCLVINNLVNPVKTDSQRSAVGGH